MINVQRLRELLKVATPGPIVLATSNSWRRIEARRGGEVCAPTVQPDGHPDLCFPNGGAEGPDATLLIEAYNYLPALLDELDALRTDQDRLREALRWTAGTLQASCCLAGPISESSPFKLGDETRTVAQICDAADAAFAQEQA